MKSQPSVALLHGFVASMTASIRVLGKLGGEWRRLGHPGFLRDKLTAICQYTALSLLTEGQC